MKEWRKKNFLNIKRKPKCCLHIKLLNAYNNYLYWTAGVIFCLWLSSNNPLSGTFCNSFSHHVEPFLREGCVSAVEEIWEMLESDLRGTFVLFVSASIISNY